MKVYGARSNQPGGRARYPRDGVEEHSCSSRTGRELAAAKASVTVGGRAARAGNSEAARLGTIGGAGAGVAATRQAWRPRGCSWRWRKVAVVTALAKAVKEVATDDNLGTAGGEQRPWLLIGGGRGPRKARAARGLSGTTTAI